MNPDDKHNKDDLRRESNSSYAADNGRLQSYVDAEQQLSQFHKPVFIHFSKSHERLFLVTLIAALSLMTGCRPTMSNEFTPTIQPPAPTREVPLRFVRHNFSAICFNTIGCRVGYNGRYQIDDAPDKVSRRPPNNMHDAWGGIEGAIRNFPPPVEATWKSLDGIPHEAKLDLAVIFKEGLIWHNVPKGDMADFYRGPVADEPNIQLEVNDHTINVYMTSIVPTRTEQIPGNKNSFGRDDLFLVWTHTY